MDTIYLSQQGYDDLKSELQKLKSVDRINIIQQIAEARSAQQQVGEDNLAFYVIADDVTSQQGCYNWFQQCDSGGQTCAHNRQASAE